MLDQTGASQRGASDEGERVPVVADAAAPEIGTLNEKALHAALKEWYTEPGDRTEVPVDGYVVDIERDGLLIEIQTAGFASLKQKLRTLSRQHPVRLVYPVATVKWIVKLAEDGRSQAGHRKSPKRGTVEDLFTELVSFPTLLAQPGFSIEVLLIQEEELRRRDPTRAWRRRGWVTEERRLLEVVDRRLFESVQDLAQLLPASLAEPFTTQSLALALGKPRRLAQRMAYCLRKMKAIEMVGKDGNAILYVRS